VEWGQTVIVLAPDTVADVVMSVAVGGSIEGVVGSRYEHQQPSNDRQDLVCYEVAVRKLFPFSKRIV